MVLPFVGTQLAQYNNLPAIPQVQPLGDILNQLFGLINTYPASAIDPVLPPPANGNLYYNTVINRLMVFDGSRGKWLSSDGSTIQVGRNGNTAAGSFYRGADGLILSAAFGFRAPLNGTIVGFSYSRSDVDAATFEITSNGVTVASLASAAVGGSTMAINVNFATGNILAVRNMAAGNTTTDVQCFTYVKWRL